MKRKGFTIIELMMVVGIIAILLGIVTTAISGAIKEARDHKANSSCKIVEQAFATYYAQKGKWPGSLGSKIENGSLGNGQNQDEENGNDYDVYLLNDEEVKSMILDLIAENKKGNPLLDLSGLFVSRTTGDKAVGMDFITAVRGTKRSPKKMMVSEMNFGYPDKNGKFKTFKVLYSIPTDEMKVSKQ